MTFSHKLQNKRRNVRGVVCDELPRCNLGLHFNVVRLLLRFHLTLYNANRKMLACLEETVEMM
jgi:hypothetical protein